MRIFRQINLQVIDVMNMIFVFKMTDWENTDVLGELATVMVVALTS